MPELTGFHIVPLILVAVGLTVLLAVHRKFKSNTRSRDSSLLSREKELSFLDDSSALTPEERKKIRKALARKFQESDDGEKEDTRRKPPIDIRELEDRYLGEDK